jgi:sulfonate transport system ATP-binding protein
VRSHITRSHGTAALLVTHDLDEALYLSDRVLLLAPPYSAGAGRLVREIAIDAPRPRDRGDLSLAGLRAQLMDGLNGVVA